MNRSRQNRVTAKPLLEQSPISRRRFLQSTGAAAVSTFAAPAILRTWCQ